jgi:hypothetical protein
MRAKKEIAEDCPILESRGSLRAVQSGLLNTCWADHVNRQR